MTSSRRPWPVLFLCCVMVFVAAGQIYGMGAIYTDLMDTFGVSRTMASLVLSLCPGVATMCGVVTGPFIKWRGPRVAVILGSVVATAGFVIAYLATDIAQVVVGVGVITGFGISFSYLTAIILPATLFHDIRNVALTLYSLSSASGSAVFPLVFRRLIEEYSLRGVFLILAAVNVQTILFGVLIGLFLPAGALGPDNKNAKKEERVSQAYAPDETQDVVMVAEANAAQRNPSEAEDEIKVHNTLNKKDGAQNTAEAEETCQRNSTNSGLRDDTLDESAAAQTDDVDTDDTGNAESQNNLNRTDCPDDAIKEMKEKDPHHRNLNLMNSEQEDETPNSLNKADYTVDAATESQNPNSPNPEQEPEAEKTLNKMADTRDKVSDYEHRGQGSPENGERQEATRLLTLKAHLRIFRDTRFVLLALLGPTSFLFFVQPSMFMTDMVQSNQLSVEDGTVFISLIFAGNLTGRAAGGLFSKLLKARMVLLPSIAIMTGGVTCLMYVFCREYWHFATVSLMLGFCFGGLASTIPVCILEFVGPERYPFGIGFEYLVAGISIVLAGPYGGLIRDLAQSYEPMYYIAAGHGLVAGLLLLVPAVQHCCRRS